MAMLNLPCYVKQHLLGIILTKFIWGYICLAGVQFLSFSLQGFSPRSFSEPNVLRATASRDTGKSPVSQVPSAGFPFKEQQLKQLRAQCLVFLAFR